MIGCLQLSCVSVELWAFLVLKQAVWPSFFNRTMLILSYYTVCGISFSVQASTQWLTNSLEWKVKCWRPAEAARVEQISYKFNATPAKVIVRRYANVSWVTWYAAKVNTAFLVDRSDERRIVIYKERKYADARYLHYSQMQSIVWTRHANTNT